MNDEEIVICRRSGAMPLGLAAPPVGTVGYDLPPLRGLKVIVG